jgi:hypothetical protein
MAKTFVMSGYSVKRWDYYVCSRRKRKHDCNARRIPRAPLEAAILQQLENKLLTLESLLVIQTEMQNAWNLHTHESGQARREIEKQLIGVQAKIRNITKAISDQQSITQPTQPTRKRRSRTPRHPRQT